MIRRTLIIGAALLAAVLLGAGAAAPARASSPNAQMREALMAVRGLIDRAGAAFTDFLHYPVTRLGETQNPLGQSLGFGHAGRL